MAGQQEQGRTGGGDQRYQSLHTLQSPTKASSDQQRQQQRMASSEGGIPGRPGVAGRRTASSKGGPDADGGAGSLGRGGAPSRPGKLSKMVRMASDLFTVHNEPSRQPSFYGTMDRPPHSRQESAIADDDEEWPEEEAWGNWKLILLTLGLAGAQLTWTIELGYGTPYLLSLGLSKELTSLVWLAGPISGFVVQPIIGALSDNSSSKYRRRRWIVYATICITLSTLVLGFAGELAVKLVDLFNRGQGDWDPKRNSDIRLTRIGLAVAAFYVLDFSLNGIQAALRALVLDMVPSDQQTGANAYLARMTNIGNIVGYGFGYVNLNSTIVLHWIGGGQFRKLCIVAIAVLLFSVGVTCATQHEEQMPKRKRDKSLRATFINIFNAIRDLPIPIRRICYVQVFAWSGFFPVMFYSTTWIGVRYYLQYPNNPPDEDTATRAGSLALLFQSIIAVATSILLPAFQAAGASEYVLSRPPGKAWNLTRWFLTWWTPRNIWTASHAFFVVVMAMTFFANSREEASAIVALLGISWAITCWVPFAILMEFIREMEAGAVLDADEVIGAAEVQSIIEEEEEQRELDGASSYLSVPGGPGQRRKSTSSQRSRTSLRGRNGRGSRRSSRRSSVKSNRSSLTRLRVQKALSECAPLLEGQEEQPKEMGGTILGIHNLAIVSPQFITALLASLIFKISEITDDSPWRKKHGIESGADVVWVLRAGGVATIGALILSRWVPAPPSEQNYIEALKEASGVTDHDGEGEEAVDTA